MTAFLTQMCNFKAYGEAPELRKRNRDIEHLFVPMFKNLYPWVSSDPEARLIVDAFVKRKDFIPDKEVWKRVKKSIEHGMYQKIILTAEGFDLTDHLPYKVTKRPTQIRECLKYSRNLKIKEVGFENLKIVNFRKFARVFLVLFFVCYIALVIEVHIYTYTYRE